MVLNFSGNSTFLRFSQLQKFEAELRGCTTIFLEHFVDERSLIFWWYTESRKLNVEATLISLHPHYA